jgi:hypothetical protein
MESFDVATDERVDAPKIPVEFSERFPELGSLFGGRLNPDNGRVEVPPATITLFFEVSRLKFCVHPRTGHRIAFGSVREALDGLVGVEEALKLGHYEWKARTGQRRS